MPIPQIRLGLYFLPQLFQVGLPILIFPLVTIVLGAEDFGIYALVTGFTGIGGVLATLGLPYVFSNRFPAANADERCRIATTQLLLCLAAAAVFAVLFVVAWETLAGHWEPVRRVPTSAVILAAAATALGIPWAIALEIIVLTGRARAYAVTTVAQSIATCAAVLTALFVFNLGVVSLFVGLLATALVGLVAALAILAPYMKPLFDRNVAKENFLVGLPLALSNGIDGVLIVVERSLLTGFGGLGMIGIYSHSQQYLNAAAMGAKAITRTVWPTTLAEARAEHSDFPDTRRAWQVFYLGLAAFGVIFAMYGEMFVAWLTNDKMTPAYSLATIWFVLLLLQRSGRPQIGTLYALGRGATVARIHVVGTLFGLGALAALIPVLGIWGAVIAQFARAAAVRIGFELSSRKIRRLPWQDAWALVGGAAISLAILTTENLVLAWPERLAVTALALAVLALCARSVLAETVHYVSAQKGRAVPLEIQAVHSGSPADGEGTDSIRSR
jgi:O-antigen/teichoic acid export membrane protein